MTNPSFGAENQHASNSARTRLDVIDAHVQGKARGKVNPSFWFEMERLFFLSFFLSFVFFHACCAARRQTRPRRSSKREKLAGLAD